MKTKIINWFKERNNWHKLLAIPLTILFYMITFQAYSMIGRGLFSMFFLFICAIVWEGYREDKFGYKPEKKDITNAMIWGVATLVATIITHCIMIGKFIA